MGNKVNLYDESDYYSADAKGSRLSVLAAPIIESLDFIKAFLIAAKTPRITGNALDVGAGNGTFLYFLKKRGFRVFGTTASSAAKKAAAQRRGIQLELSTTDIPSSLQDKKYDLISYWHVFEHLTQPEIHARQCSELLHEKGVLWIEVPNIESLGAKICFDSWLGSDLKHHINHMTLAELEALFAKQGLATKSKSGFSLKFSYVFLWSALLGRIFSTRIYHFDSVFDLLKRPFSSLKARPFSTITAVFCCFLLSPAILFLMIAGCLSGRGEIIRLKMARK